MHYWYIRVEIDDLEVLMKTRVKTAIVALIIFVPLLYLGNWYFKYTTSILGILAMYEINKMTFKKINNSVLLISVIAGAIIYTNYPLPAVYFYSVFFLIGIAFLMTVVISGHKIKLTEIGVIIFLTAYVFVGFYSLFMLRELGLSYVLYLLFTIWVTDSFAYIGGMKFGKNKISPNISPNKSIEGSVIGSLSSIVVALLFYFMTTIFTNIVMAVIITLVISAIGQIGDLIESAYKRECGVKDSSNLLPGHGGIFDRFDSVILAAPCLALLLNLIA